MKKINFENKPSTNSPINATNLNLLQDNVEDEFDNKIGNLSDLDTNDKENLVNAINEVLSKYAPIELYNNSSGAYGNITLSDNASSYTYMEIFFSGNDGSNYQASVKVCNPNGKTVSLLYTLNDGTAQNFYFKVKNVLINGTTISNVDGRYADATFFNSASPAINKVDHIRINKVIGYKY